MKDGSGGGGGDGGAHGDDSVHVAVPQGDDKEHDVYLACSCHPWVGA